MNHGLQIVQKTLYRMIDVHPSKLNSSITEFLKERIYSLYVHSCSEDGVIIDIKKIINITNQISIDNCSVLFGIIFEAEVLKPEIGSKITFKASRIIQKGIFGKLYEGMINLFIPSTDIINHEYIPDDNGSFVNKKTNQKNKTKTISCESVITCVVKAVKFDRDSKPPKYNCICKIF